MIAETANLATGQGVVKRACNANGRFPNQLSERKLTDRRSDFRNAEMVEIIEDIDVRSIRDRIKLEQSAEKDCLTVCQRGRQRRTPLCVLPGGGTSE